jgi:putative membrane protein
MERRRFIDPVSAPVDEAAIHQIERPHPNLWKYYILCCLMVFPLAPILLPIHWFRYHSMRYRFTAEGVSMSWGVLFRRQILLNYARIQDIHLQSNLVERWLGLGRLLIQTASGSSTAEMTIEGLQEFEAVRDFLYARMRGVKDHPHPMGANAGEPSAAAGSTSSVSGASDAELAALLREIATEVRTLRESVEHQAGTRSGGDRHV